MQDTISKIEERIRGAGALKEENRMELLRLLGELKAQINALSQTHQDQARSIAGYTEISAHEATRASKNSALLKHSVLGLETSVSEMEVSHPQLAAVVNRLATMLSNMGI
jgi:hypothetical protein